MSLPLNVPVSQSVYYIKLKILHVSILLTQGRYGHSEEEKSMLPLPGIEPPVIRRVVRLYTDWAVPAPYIYFHDIGVWL
jgi:hypothetical protein